MDTDRAEPLIQRLLAEDPFRDADSVQAEFARGRTDAAASRPPQELTGPYCVGYCFALQERAPKPVQKSIHQLVAEELRKDPAYCKMKYERGQLDARDGRPPREYAGPYYEGYSDESCSAPRLSVSDLRPTCGVMLRARPF